MKLSRITFASIMALVAPSIPFCHSFIPSRNGASVVGVPSFVDKRCTTSIRETSEETKLDIPTLVGDAANGVKTDEDTESEEPPVIENDKEEEEENKFDSEMMMKAIEIAKSSGGERGADSPFPKPIAGAIIVTKDGKVLGQGRSTFQQNCVEAAIADTGLVATPLREWCVAWPSSAGLRHEIAESTLYVTLEPSSERQGTIIPPITQLIELSGVPRVVIGCQDPIPERASEGAATLHAAGLSVSVGVEQEKCENLVPEYASLATSKLQKMGRVHFQRYGRPIGFLHCSVIDSDEAEAFARHGNAFGKNFGGQNLSFRDFGSYAMAPPPEAVWAQDDDEDDDFDAPIDGVFNMDFEEEEEDNGIMDLNPMMPWYEQVDACVATFPKKGNGPADDNSISARLFGLKWLATIGEELPPGVERILVMDATDLVELPIMNDDPNLPEDEDVDVESFWRGEGRKATRVLLRHGDNAQAIAAATAAAKAAAAAAEAAVAAKDAIESGDAEAAAEAALEYTEAARSATEFVQQEMQVTQDLKQKLLDMGAKVEVIKGGEPIDVMNHLGERNGYTAVVWRAGCWGERGVKSILAGAFQWVSAHLAVDAIGGKFWQLMIAERAVQAACGPESKVKVFADQEDISLEYCDNEEADQDCVLTVDGRPVRHVRLDCRVALVDGDRRRELVKRKTKPITQHLEEEAPWFL